MCLLFLVHGQVISLEQNERGIDQHSSPAKWQLPKLAFTVTSEAATNSPFRTDQDLAILTYSSSSYRHTLTSGLYHTHLGHMHAHVHRRTCVQHICTHTRSHASSITPANLLLFFYVYLFLSLVVFPFINTSTLRYKKWAIFTYGSFKKKKMKEEETRSTLCVFMVVNNPSQKNCGFMNEGSKEIRKRRQGTLQTCDM